MLYPEIRMILRDEGEYHRLANGREDAERDVIGIGSSLGAYEPSQGRYQSSRAEPILPPSVLNTFERFFGS